MFKIAAIVASILFICGMTVVVIPSAFSFEDYITSDTTIQEAGGGEEEQGGDEAVTTETEEAPVTDEDALSYEDPQDETETIEEQDITEQDEPQDSEELNYEEEPGEMK